MRVSLPCDILLSVIAVNDLHIGIFLFSEVHIALNKQTGKVNISSFKSTQNRQKSRSIASAASVLSEQIFSALEWLILLCPFLCGGFFPWASAPVSLILVVLQLLLLRRGLLCPTRSAPFLAAVSIVLFHLGGIFWGTDRGMALVGAVQFLPLPLFILLLEQFAPDRRIGLLRKMPYAASAMVLLSFLLSCIPSLAPWFLVAGRQAGFFQYPNTYAVYLLLALVLVLFGTPLRFGKLPWAAVTTLGIILSGSRTVFFLLLAVFLVFFFTDKSKQSRLHILILAALVLFGSVLYVLLSGNRGSVGRFLTVSLTSSEFVGRLLYARDALPVILRHPLGLGYTGYRCLQGSFQTGVYSVQHVHNELFQLLLDVGWIPAALFLWALWRGFRSREGGLCRKLLLAVLVLHCLLDFDTQFVSVALLLFLVLDVEPQAQKPVSSGRAIRGLSVGILTVSALFSLWIGTASFLYYLRKPADAVLRLNKAVALAHDARAKADFSAGNFSGMIAHKQKAIRLSRYNLTEYLDYFDILRYARERYLQHRDPDSADSCLSLIAEIPEMLETVDAQTSRLGRIIRDKPDLTLPPPYVSWLEQHASEFVSNS